MYQYIKNIDISYRQKNIEFFNMSRYLLYVTIFSIYCDILRQKFTFLLLHYQDNENKRGKRQTNRSKLTIVS